MTNGGLPRRSAQELGTLARLEQDQTFVVVEGRFDQCLAKEALSSVGCKALIYRVDEIDVPGVVEGGHRGRVVRLAELVAGQVRQADNLFFIIDRDLDDLLAVDIQTKFLRYTDGSCMESYIFDEDGVKKFARKLCDAELQKSEIDELFSWLSRYVALLAARHMVASDVNLPTVARFFFQRSAFFYWPAYLSALRSAVGGRYDEMLRRWRKLRRIARDMERPGIIQAEAFKECLYLLLRERNALGRSGRQQFERDVEVFCRLTEICGFPLFQYLVTRGAEVS